MSGMTIKQALAVIRSEVGYHAGSDTHYRAEKLDQSLATLRAEIDGLRAEVERLRTDLMESDEIREKLGHLLTRTAAALKGEPPAGVWHSWHDLPERAAQLAEALRRYRNEVPLGHQPHMLAHEVDALLHEQEEGHG